MKELRDCPFCNGKGELQTHATAGVLKSYVRCGHCAAQGSQFITVREEDEWYEEIQVSAIEAWNGEHS